MDNVSGVASIDEFLLHHGSSDENRKEEQTKRLETIQRNIQTNPEGLLLLAKEERHLVRCHFTSSEYEYSLREITLAIIPPDCEIHYQDKGLVFQSQSTQSLLHQTIKLIRDPRYQWIMGARVNRPLHLNL